MSERKFDSLVPRINTSVNGCPQPLMIDAIRNSAIRTCERTLMWRTSPAPFQLTAGVFEYFYRKPRGAEVHTVFDAAINGFPLRRVTLEEALRHHPGWAELYGGASLDDLWSDSGTFDGSVFDGEQFNGGGTFEAAATALKHAGEPRIFTQLTPDKFVVLPLPDNDQPYNLRMFYALRPKRDAEGMPEFIFSELEDCIFHGALQDLLVLPNESWGDRDLAAYHARQFLYHVTERRARANMGNMRATVSVKMQPFC